MHFRPVKRFVDLTAGPSGSSAGSGPVQHRSGFTLLEILLAVFILGTVLSTIYTSYSGTFRIVNETEYEGDIYRMARIAMERISEDLASAYLPQQEFGEEEDPFEPEEEPLQLFQFAGETRGMEGQRADTLQFTSLAHLVFSDDDEPGAIARISYYVEQGAEDEGLVLFRLDDPAFGFSALREEAAGGLVLCDRLQSVSFTYHGIDGEPYDDWDSGDESFDESIPAMVTIQLEFVNRSDAEAPYKFKTAVALPMIGGEEEEES